MKLADILTKLSLGPLSEQAAFGTGAGSIDADKVPKLVFHIGQALVALYTRFPLRMRSLELETVDGLFEYPLQPRFAQSSTSTEINKFIKDSIADPFLGDVLKITAISEAGSCKELPLNKRHDELSWFTPGYDTVRMGYPKTGDRYRIEYRARHPQLEPNPTDPAEVEIQLPDELVPALLAHVAGQVYGGMSMEGALGKSQGFLATYENECQMHESINTWDQHNEPFNTKFAERGWI